jgi:hypothetical protein
MTSSKYLLLLAGIVLVRGTAAATPVSVGATADTFVDSAQPTGNFGGAGAMQVTAAGNSYGQLISLVKFDPTAIATAFNSQYGTGNWTPTAITLDLGTNFGTQGVIPNNSIFAPINAGMFQIVLMQNTGWTEGSGTPGSPTTDGLTYNQLSNYTSASDVSLGTFSWTAAGNGVYAFNLGTNATLESDIANDQTISLEFVAADTGVSFLFDSRTYGTTSYRESLSANAVPEPSAWSLLVLCGSIFLGCKWRKRRRA